MELSALDQMLLATLDDEQLTRNERQALSQIIEEESPDSQKLALYRCRAFEIARQHLGRHADVLTWLEGITKVLSPVEAAGPVVSNAYFSPGDDCPGRIVDVIRQSRKTLDICVFTITYDQIASAIIQAHKRGVAVRVITDEAKSRDVGSDVQRMIREGVPTRLEQTDHHMHHKFAIIDDQSLLNGSYNWTRGAALYNQENFIITNDPSLLRSFGRVFEKLWAEFE